MLSQKGEKKNNPTVLQLSKRTNMLKERMQACTQIEKRKKLNNNYFKIELNSTAEGKY